jgi:hypothetical protein
MHWRALSFIVMCFVLTSCWERTPEYLTSAAPQCRCEQSVEDRFEQPQRFEFGGFNGQCVDSCRFRKAQILAGILGARFGADAGHLVIANFRHEGKYWIARVPVTAVHDVDVLFENFYHGITHVALRFHLDEEMKLFTQNASEKQAPRGPIRDLVLSIEGVPGKDRPYRVIDSARGHYLLDYRVQSGAETADTMVRKQGHVVKQYRLTLPDAAPSRILRHALAASERESFASIYNLSSNNCATAALDLIAQGIQYEPDVWTRWRQFDRGWSVDALNGTLRALRTMGTLKPGEAGRLPNLTL